MGVVFALCRRNLVEFARNRASVIFSLVLPFFFIYVFSAIFQQDGIENPILFMLAGIVTATVFQFSLSISSTTITDMASGFMKEVLVSPVSRLSVALGQFLSSAIIASVQGMILLAGGIFLGFRITEGITVLYILVALVAIALVFAGFGLFIASNAKNTQTFQVMTMAIVLPMTFLSGAYIPLSLVPGLLQTISWFNPLTYAVALFRTISLERLGASRELLIQEELAIEIGNFVVMPWMSAVILLVFGGLFLLLSTVKFARTDFSKMSRNVGDYVEW